MFVRLGTFSSLGSVAFLAIVVALFATGCSEDTLPVEGDPPVGGCPQLCGRTVLAETGEGLGPVLLALLRLNDLAITAIQTTGDDGSFTFEGVPAGDYVPLVYDDVYGVARLPAPSFPLADGDTMTVVVPLVELDELGPGDRIRGRVIDAVTGDPIAGAMAEIFEDIRNSFRSVRPPFLELSGQTGSGNRATNEAGFFEIGPVLCFGLPGQMGITTDLLIRKPGYRSLRVPGFDCSSIPTDTLTYSLQPGSDPFSLSGQVVDVLGNPLEGIEIGLEWVTGLSFGPGPGKRRFGEVALWPKVILQGLVAVSGPDGRFEFVAVPEGLHQIFPGYRMGDGWERVRLTQPGPGWSKPEGRVEGGDLDVGTLAVAHMSRPVFPPDGAQPDSVVTLVWQPVPWATLYGVTVTQLDCDADCVRASDLLSAPQATLNEPLGPGDYIWRARGYLPPEVELDSPPFKTIFERSATFTIPPLPAR